MRGRIEISIRNGYKIARNIFESVEDAVRWIEANRAILDKDSEILEEPVKIQVIQEPISPEHEQMPVESPHEEEPICQPVKETKSKKTSKTSKTASPKK
jgi:hypothetical protein